EQRSTMPSYKLRRYGPLNNWYAFYSEGRRSKSWSTRTDDQKLAKKRSEAFFANLVVDTETQDDPMIRDLLLRYRDDKDGTVVAAYTSNLNVDNLLAHYDGRTVSFITAA